MLSKWLSSVLMAVFSFAIRIPDQLLEMAWIAVIAVAPLRTNVPIDINSLYAWNVLPYCSANVPVSHYAKLLAASHKCQGVIKDQQWREVQDNLRAVRHSTMKYIEDEVGSISVASYSSLILKALRSLFLFIKAQQSFKESRLSLVHLKEMQREEEETATEEIAEE